MPELSQYHSGSAGVSVAFHLKGDDDDLYHKDADKDRFTQVKPAFKYTQSSLVLQPVNSVGHSGPKGELIRSAPFQGTTYTIVRWPGLVPNEKSGVSRTSYINARGFLYVRGMVIKVGSSSLFTTDSHQMMCLTEFTGALYRIARDVGFFLTEADLINASSKDSFTYMPWVTLTTNSTVDQAFGIGGINWHPVNVEYSVRSVNELVVNYGDVVPKNGLFVLPRTISSGKTLSSNNFEMVHATKLFWVEESESKQLEDGYRETYFTKYNVAGEKVIARSKVAHQDEVPLEMKSCVNYAFVTIQSSKDIAKGLHTKLCNDNDEDYIDEIMLFGANSAVEDGLPAECYRKIKVEETFGTKIRRHIYLLPFCDKIVPGEIPRHRNFTNYNDVKLKLKFKPHDDDLTVRVDYASNGCYWTDAGTVSKSA